MNILLGAYSCKPNHGSEGEVDWQMAISIANEINDDNLYVIT